MIDESNKRIVRNAVAIYLRMFISVIVSLYTSRVVLQVLGASDYGIYALVGGVVVMFSFMNNAMAGSTSRFINYTMGLNDPVLLKRTFRTAILSHTIISLSVLVLCETIGVWLLSNKLVIPEERMLAAHIVMQLSIFSMCIGIMQGPFSACIIAHEKINIYAYVEILVVILKLIIVYALLVVNYDKLIVYAILTCLVSLITMIIYIYYSKIQFQEVSFLPLCKKDLLYPMLSFSGWRFFGCLTDTFTAQGRNMILNIFWGTVINAAAGIANTIQEVISGFAYNVMVAFRPQIVISYAEKKYSKMQSLVEEAFSISNLLFFLVGVPVFAECDYILKLWLVDVPAYTVPLVRVTLLVSLISNCYGFAGTIIGAAGNIKLSQINIGVLNLISILVAYVLLKCGFSPVWAYYPLVFIYIVIFLVNFYLIKKYIPALNLRSLFVNGFLKEIIILLCSSSVLWMNNMITEPGFLRLITNVFFNTLIIGIGCYCFIMSSSLKLELFNKLKSFL